MRIRRDRKHRQLNVKKMMTFDDERRSESTDAKLSNARWQAAWNAYLAEPDCHRRREMLAEIKEM